MHLRFLSALILLSEPLAAQTQDNPPADLSASPQLTHDKGESWTFAKSALDLSKYSAVQVAPTVVYAGPDAQFGNIAPGDRRKFADLLTAALRTELTASPGLSKRAGAGILQIRLTLLGAEKTTGGVSTAAHVMPLGFVTNAVKSVAGKRGSFTGSVLLAIEVSDSTSGELLAAAVRREAPDALDIEATLSTTDTIKAIADDVAEKICKRLEKAMRRNG